MTSPIDMVQAQIGIPASLTVRNCMEHGKFLVPKHSKFKCPDCMALNSIPNGTCGNGDTAEFNEIKVNELNAIKHYISLGM